MLKSILLSAVLTTGVAAAALAQTSTSPSTPSTSPSTTAPATTAPSTAPATTLPTTRPSAAAPSTTVTTTTAAAPNAMKGSTLMDLKVKNSADETIGEIDDVIVSTDGKVEQVIVSVGGFLGIGERKVAIAWQDVKFDATREVAMVNMTKDQLKTAPEFKDRRAAVRTDRPATDRPLTGAVPATPPAPATPADKPKTSP